MERKDMTVTHESYIHAIRAAILDRCPNESRDKLASAKLVYGSGMRGTRGTTYYGAWHCGESHAFVEVCATGEESDVQLAGTTIHELAHVLAGIGSGHGPAWKQACGVLGLAHAEAAGQSYTIEHFEPTVWQRIAALDVPTDGLPFARSGRAIASGAGAGGSAKLATPRPCNLGIGTRGGRSRGAGSGSRLRLWHCACAQPVKVRIASDDFQATCKRCGADFHRV